MQCCGLSSASTHLRPSIKPRRPIASNLTGSYIAYNDRQVGLAELEQSAEGQMNKGEIDAAATQPL